MKKFLKISALSAVLVCANGDFLMAQTVEMRIGSKSYSIELNGNDAAQDFARRLTMELQFEDYAGTERIAYLNPKLNVGEAPTHMTPRTGDIAYYVPWGNLAVFVRGFRPSESLVPLGSMSTEAWQALQSSGDEAVRFSLQR